MGLHRIGRVAAVLMSPSKLSVWVVASALGAGWDLSHGPHRQVNAAIDVLMGMALAYVLVVGLRWRRANRSWLQAAAEFRAAVSALEQLPTFYVNSDAGVMFGYEESGRWWTRTQYLTRAREDDVDEVNRMMDDGGIAVATAEQYQLRPGTWMVFRSVIGDRFRRYGETIDLADPDRRTGRIRGMRARYRALTDGLLHANELELRTICGELAGARPIHREENDDAA